MSLEADTKKNSLATKIWRVLDTPVIDLASASFNKPAEKEPPATEQHLLSAQRTTLFDSLDNLTLDENMHVDRGDEVSVMNCFKSSCKWSWEAGKTLLAIKTMTSTVSAIAPYAITFSSAKVIDGLVKIAQDNAVVGISEANFWFGVTAASGLVAVGNNILNSYVRQRHSTMVAEHLMSKTRKALSNFSPAERVSPKIQQLITRTMIAQHSLRSFGDQMFELVVPTASIAGALALVAPQYPVMAGALFMFSIPYMYHAYKRGREQLDVSTKTAEKQNRLNGRDWSQIVGAANIQLQMYDKDSELVTHLNEEHKKLAIEMLEPAINDQKRNLWLQPLNSVTVASMVYVVLTDAIAGAGASSGLTVGTYGLLTGALYSLNASISSLSYTLGPLMHDLPQAKVALSVIQEGLVREAERKPQRPAFEEAPKVEISNLTFSYPKTTDQENPIVLNNVSLTIQPGEILGVVGQSGCGKSSLVQVLTGIYPPTSGDVKFNEQDISTIAQRSLWKSSAYLEQQAPNFESMSLRENILIGASRLLSDEEILEICKETGLLEIMNEKKINLDSIVGNWFFGGTAFSGGQNATLAMTRQAASGAKFLILDEPTNGLDQEKADAVLARIRSLTDVTRVVISHDFGIAAQADRILVLDRGKVVGIDSHKNLLRECDVYRKSFERQQKRLRFEAEF